MAGAGDYVRFQLLYNAKILDRQVLITDGNAQLKALIVPTYGSDYQLYIQKITFRPVVYAAQTWVFQDEASTPVQIGQMVFPSTAPTIVTQPDYQIDLGPTGYALTIGSPLDIVVTGTGVAGALHIEGYQRGRTDGVGIRANANPNVPNWNVIADPTNIQI